MPEANQITWTHKELVTLLVKERGIHEGRWVLLLNFGMAPANMGPNDDFISPGMMFGVTSIGIQREPPDVTSASSLVVDAAEVNPPPKAAASGRPRAASAP